MNLVYVWNENYLNKENYKQTGFCLTSKYEINYNSFKEEVRIVHNPSYISGFWGANIFDVIAIVGDNGAGKTMLLNYIMDILKCMNSGNTLGMEFFAIFEDEDSNTFKIMATSKYQKMRVNSEIQAEMELVSNIPKYILSLYKFGYFTNALSLNDYQTVKFGNIYDASVGGLIRNITNEDIEMHYKGIDEDRVLNYYNNQFRRVIEFVITSDIYKFDIPFNLPKKVDIYINKSQANEEYIIEQLEKMKIHNTELREILMERKFCFNFYFRPIIKKYSYTWISNLITSLIINLFRELCIPQTTREYKDKDALKFIKLLECLKKKKNREDTIYKEIKVFFRDIGDSFNKDYYCLKYQKFIAWLEDNDDIISANCKYSDYCSIPLDKKYEKFLMELLDYYKKTCFAFPYFTFKLGLSTGELNFLNIFANLYNMLEINEEGKKK